MANRPTGRTKYYRKWNDVLNAYNYDKALSTSERAGGASWRLHDPESPVKKTFNPKKQQAQRRAAAEQYRASQGVKRSEKTLLQSMQAPVPKQKPADPQRVKQKAARLTNRTNWNAPVQKLKYYRKKR